mmetsp:Transcript_27538/g.58837  ORF Transcript_27538/g.58837 Transcript_27538/m.58837 type:complete len:137 (-) Transcript_27538:601-1011(-)
MGVDFKAVATGASSATTAASGMSFSRKLRRIKNWGTQTNSKLTVPSELYIGLSILRAIDLGMTNLAMQYVNYPAKTLMKSTGFVFTMIFDILVTKSQYGAADFIVAGLGMYVHAKTSVVFQPLGIIVLTISLLLVI